MEEIFRLPDLNNPIPAGETNVSSPSFNSVALVNDLSDLFLPGAIPASPSFKVIRSGFFDDPGTNLVFQVVDIINTSFSPAPAPLFLALDNLSTNATLANAAGTTAVLPPLGSPYVNVHIDFDDEPGFAGTGPDEEDFLFPFLSSRVLLEFLDPSGTPITYTTRVLSVTPTP